VNPLNIFTILGPPIEWALTHLTTYFHNFGISQSIGAFGLAIIIVTLVIRGALFPVFAWQLRTTRRIQAEQRLIAPQMQEIRKKYKKEPQKLQEEMMKLYREHNISPFSSLTGCLPMLVQLPIIYGLYNGIRSATGSPDVHSNLGFLWVSDVSQSPSSAGGFGHPTAMIIPVLAAAATVVQSKMMMQPPRPNMSDQERQMYSMSKNLMFLAPAMVLIFGINLPQGLALYWVTQSIFMIIQQWYVLGWGGLKVPPWFPGAGRVTKLSVPQQLPARAGAAGGDGRGRDATRGREARTPVAQGKQTQRSQNGRTTLPQRSAPRRVTHSSGSRRKRGR
jgi:YidC/Oxa1 family membrane protein insertase